MAAFGFTFFLALAISLPTLAMLPPWGDEIITLQALALPWNELIPERLSHAHSPLYFLVLKLLGLGADSLFLLRLPSALGVAIGGAFTTLAAWRLGGGRNGGWPTALAFALAYACFPVILSEAQDARPNGPLFGLIGILLWSTCELVEHPRLARAALSRAARQHGKASRRLRWAWFAAGGSALAAMAILPLGGFAVLAMDTATLWAGRKRPGRRLLLPWFAIRAATLLALAPLFYGLASGIGSYVGDFWPPAFGWDSLSFVLKVANGGLLQGPDPDWFLGAGGNRALYWGLFIFIALGALWARRRHSLAVLVSLALLPQLLLALISLHTSILVGRYFAVSSQASLVFAALGFAGLWHRRRWLAALAGPAMAALLFLQALDTMHNFSKPRFTPVAVALRAAGIERLGLVVHSWIVGFGVTANLEEGPPYERLSPLAAVMAARNGLPILVVIRSFHGLDSAWPAFVSALGFEYCEPQADGLAVLIFGRSAAEFAPLCKEGSRLDTETLQHS